MNRGSDQLHDGPAAEPGELNALAVDDPGAPAGLGEALEQSVQQHGLAGSGATDHEHVRVHGRMPPQYGAVLVHGEADPAGLVGLVVAHQRLMLGRVGDQGG